MKLVNIRNDDIADGNPKLTLGLIWTIILHFQVSAGTAGLVPGVGRWWGPRWEGGGAVEPCPASPPRPRRSRTSR